ncbi:hypothetical protein CGRA01v4_06111 [Colletotrichum graminicola]|nr:hypothetical protein CGRA01v4_06111 [Colletotrichum graminicola]
MSRSKKGKKKRQASMKGKSERQKEEKKKRKEKKKSIGCGAPYQDARTERQLGCHIIFGIPVPDPFPSFFHSFPSQPPPAQIQIPRDNEVALHLLKGAPLELDTTLRRESCPPLSLSCKRPLRGCLRWAPLQSSSHRDIQSLLLFSTKFNPGFHCPVPSNGTALAHSRKSASDFTQIDHQAHYSPGYERPIRWKKISSHPPLPTSTTSTSATPATSIPLSVLNTLKTIQYICRAS